MFLQIVQGTVGDRDAVRASIDRWLRELEPGAEGWLGGTYGITQDDTLVAIVRFESPEAARRNSERPEQQDWWLEMQRHFTGKVAFRDCTDVTLLLRGGSDQARFVQVIQGRVRDRGRVHALTRSSAELLSAYRPDILGATIAIDDEGFITETVAFTSEEDARAAEGRAMPAEVKQLVDDELALVSDVSYLDLHEPWFASHR